MRGCRRNSSATGTLLTAFRSFTWANSGASWSLLRTRKPTTTSAMLIRNGIRQP